MFSAVNPLTRARRFRAARDSAGGGRDQSEFVSSKPREVTKFATFDLRF
jgi:hypothetical protein